MKFQPCMGNEGRELITRILVVKYKRGNGIKYWILWGNYWELGRIFRGVVKFRYLRSTELFGSINSTPIHS